LKEWQLWENNPELESRYNIERVKGNLSEMESTKQLVELISDVYKPGMNVLDVGCNVGHYLVGIRKKFPELDYTGVDAYESYIEDAKKMFSNDHNAKFETRDIFKPIYPENKFDIVYCCNVLLHLPDFRIPLSNLLNSTKDVCYIRTLLSDHTTIVQSPLTDVYDNEGKPTNYWYLNTWNKGYFDSFVRDLGWKTEYIEDKFNPQTIQEEYEKTKNDPFDTSTKILNNKQVVHNIIFNWVWVKITNPR